MLFRSVAKEIGKDNLIFPAITEDKQLEENSKFNVVNKILAIGFISDEKGFDKKLKDAIKARLKKIYEDSDNNIGIFDEIERKLGKDKAIFYRTNAEDQINDLTELYWAAIPYDESKDNYGFAQKVEKFKHFLGNNLLSPLLSMRFLPKMFDFLGKNVKLSTF